MKTNKSIILSILFTAIVCYTNSTIAVEIISDSGELKTKAFFTKELRFTILYDNYEYTENTKINWGFACLIEGDEASILFDTGTNPETLFKNIECLNADLSKLKYVFISHDHYDHTGGLIEVLKRYKGLTVFVTESFPVKSIEKYKELGAKIVKTDKAKEIFKDVYTTGEMGTTIKEQSLIFDTEKGAVVVTGCSHQGITSILDLVKYRINKKIHFVFGGFHLLRHKKEEIDVIVKKIKENGVEKCGATHCTGAIAIGKFEEAFKEDFVKMGTGKTITINQ